VKPEPTTYDIFNPIGNLILRAIGECYSALEPENLSCDGEASISAILSMKTRLERQLRGLIIAHGSPVSQEEAFKFMEFHQKFVNAD
jgi:hypothetical protein